MFVEPVTEGTLFGAQFVITELLHGLTDDVSYTALREPFEPKVYLAEGKSMLEIEMHKAACALVTIAERLQLVAVVHTKAYQEREDALVTLFKSTLGKYINSIEVGDWYYSSKPRILNVGVVSCNATAFENDYELVEFMRNELNRLVSESGLLGHLEVDVG